MKMQDALVPEELWQRIEPLLPPHKCGGSRGGRRPVPDRACLAGIIFVLQSGCPWRLVPCDELECGSPTTVWRRFKDWTAAGVWDRLHEVLLVELAARGQIDLSRAVIDAQRLRALFGGDIPVPTPPTEPRMAAKGT
jgi:transposase